MCVDESWGDYFALTVDDSGGRWWTDIRRDLSDSVAFDKEVGVLEGSYGIVGFVKEKSTALEQDGRGRHAVVRGCRARKDEVLNVDAKQKLAGEVVLVYLRVLCDGQMCPRCRENFVNSQSGFITCQTLPVVLG